MAKISENNYIAILSDEEIDQIYESALSILENPGFKFDSDILLKSLADRGAAVDYNKNIARIPRGLVEEAIAIAAKEEADRIKAQTGFYPGNSLAFSWHSAFARRSPDLAISIGGGCPQYLDYEKNLKRDSTYHDYLRVVQLGEALPEVRTIGNPLHMVVDENGERTNPRMMAIKGAALIAKNTSKPGLSVLLHPEQLEYLIEIGIVVRGSWEAYKESPIFINNNCTGTPLSINSHECGNIEALAERDLPVMIIPMPLTGVNVPVTLASAVMLGVAEILGTWAAVKAMNPEAPVEAGVITGTMDGRTGAASFSSPECILQDIAIAQIFRHRLKTRCSVGVGFNDASYPGAASTMHRAFKLMAAAACGEVNYPIGILNAGVVFSPEQAMMDLELSQAVDRFYRGFEVNPTTLAVELVRELGPGAIYFDQEHTAEHMRSELWGPDIFTKSKQGELQEEMKRDMVPLAHEKWKNILASSEPYQIEKEKAIEIDRIVAYAERKLRG